MKLHKLTLALSAAALGLCLQPNISWSSRALGPAITGTVTAAPSSGSIEIDHRSYPIKAGSTAATVLSSVYVGETVDIILDGPPGGTVEVIIITEHQG
ncbi:MAG TPA: hypothetical protein VHW95_17730 [Steroidobacteraceae bacterium]|jgi:hypothetical protein|nr:hypothetical protein [Steroidobacteraceae bacterium]